MYFIFIDQLNYKTSIKIKYSLYKDNIFLVCILLKRNQLLSINSLHYQYYNNNYSLYF